MMVAMLKMMKILIMIAKLNSDDEENDADCNVENYEKIDYDCNVEDYEENDYDCNGKMMKSMTLIAMLKSAKSFFFMMSLKSIIFLLELPWFSPYLSLVPPQTHPVNLFLLISPL